MATKKTTHASASYASLDVEAATPKPYTYTTKADHVVTFPDPGEMDFEDAEEWLLDMARATNSQGLKKWLSEEDYAALREDGLNLRQMLKLAAMVQRHYKDIFGELGE